MKQQTNKNISKTDKAWNQLYSRLQQDGLLTDIAGKKRSVIFSVRNTGWAAAILLLFISATVALLTNRPVSPEPALFTLQNKQDATVLVKTLEDGSVIYLADNSQIQYPEHFATDKRTVSLKGNALFNVSGNKERPFLIETEDMQIEVIGTAFNVKNSNNKLFELSVQHGTVKVTYRQNNESVFVNAGETATLLSRRLQISKTQDLGQFARYTKQMQFKDERLADILQVVNQANPGISIETTPSMKEHRLTVRFINNSPEEIAQLICAALNLKYTREKNIVFISEP